MQSLTAHSYDTFTSMTESLLSHFLLVFRTIDYGKFKFRVMLALFIELSIVFILKQ
jgi:hypothetical protein